MISLFLLSIALISILGVFLLDWYYSKFGYPIHKSPPEVKKHFELYIPSEQIEEKLSEEDLVNVDHLAHLQRKFHRHG